MDNVIRIEFGKKDAACQLKGMLEQELIDKLDGYADKPPTSQLEYLAVLKDLLEDEDYRDILCGILDIDIYNDLEPKLKEFVELYFSME